MSLILLQYSLGILTVWKKNSHLLGLRVKAQQWRKAVFCISRTFLRCVCVSVWSIIFRLFSHVRIIQDRRWSDHCSASPQWLSTAAWHCIHTCGPWQKSWLAMHEVFFWLLVCSSLHNSQWFFFNQSPTTRWMGAYLSSVAPYRLWGAHYEHSWAHFPCSMKLLLSPFPLSFQVPRYICSLLWKW